ncbi:MAG: DUF4238 domain-containing protein [Chromatiaceae bacterium]|nr:DUF4238 domain-containing protein [Chromatiaceae bacterium]MBP8288517.1 DUF4238 domain-containing protein [Chromatiaceae bacterium]MBP9602897.1 DUF4238 domain-containing protein [Chromatiaceae bacterium]
MQQTNQNMSSLTKNQHNVPAFYLRQWRREGTDNVVCHDLHASRVFDVSPGNILARRYFYEENAESPDNRVENVLANMEGACSSYFEALNYLNISRVSYSNEKLCAEQVRNSLTNHVCEAIKTFAAYQYLRVPGAIDQKRYELTLSELNELQKDYLLNAGRFVDSGFNHVKNRFLSLKLLVLMSTGQNFITSDWPCFDMKDSDSSPLLGEEIGNSPEVVAYFPLNPRLGVVLYPENHAIHVGSHRMPEAHVIPAVDSIVRNQNTLVIQQAEKFVVANTTKDFVFKVAKKRKKSNGA